MSLTDFSDDFLDIIKEYREKEADLEAYIHAGENSLQRCLTSLKMEQLLELTQVVPEHLGSKLFELAEPKSSGRALWRMDFADRARYMSEFSKHSREAVMKTYDEDEASLISSEYYIWNNIEALVESVGHLANIEYRRSRKLDGGSSVSKADDANSVSERSEKSDSEDGGSEENESDGSCQSEDSDTYVDSEHDRSD
jgi:hypothetical protein